MLSKDELIILYDLFLKMMKIRLPYTKGRIVVVLDVIAELFASLDCESYGFPDVDGTVKLNKKAIFIWILT